MWYGNTVTTGEAAIGHLSLKCRAGNTVRRMLWTAVALGSYTVACSSTIFLLGALVKSDSFASDCSREPLTQSFVWGRNVGRQLKTSLARVLLQKHLNNTSTSSPKSFSIFSRFLSYFCRLPSYLQPHTRHLRLSHCIHNGCSAKHLCVRLRYDSASPKFLPPFYS